MNRAILAFLISSSIARADFNDDPYAEQPNALTRTTAAAEQEGSQFRSSSDGHTSYSLRRAEYIGPCEAPFGKVYIARLFYIRSVPKGWKSPARGHTFIVFLDRDFVIRSHWSVDHTLGQLAASGSKLFLDNKELFDFAHPPASGQVVAGGDLLPTPRWK